MGTAETTKQSRIGKRLLEVPAGVTLSVTGSEVKVKGPKGETSYAVPDILVVKKDGNNVQVTPRPGAGKRGTQFQGLARALLGNMVEGVTKGFQKSLDFRGVGYRAEFKNDVLTMTVGLSHQVKLDIPKIVKVRVETIDEAGTKYPRVHLESFDKQLVGQVAARIRSARPPEPYKGKGVRYTGERIREKAGKAGKAK